MSTKLFINAFSSLFSQNRGRYIRCVCVCGGGGSHPFFRQINIKKYHKSSKMFHLAISNMAQRNVAFCERHVALRERHVALLIFRQ